MCKDNNIINTVHFNDANTDKDCNDGICFVEKNAPCDKKGILKRSQSLSERCGLRQDHIVPLSYITGTLEKLKVCRTVKHGNGLHTNEKLDAAACSNTWYVHLNDCMAKYMYASYKFNVHNYKGF